MNSRHSGYNSSMMGASPRRTTPMGYQSESVLMNSDPYVRRGGLSPPNSQRAMTRPPPAELYSSPRASDSFSRNVKKPSDDFYASLFGTSLAGTDKRPLDTQDNVRRRNYDDQDFRDTETRRHNRDDNDNEYRRSHENRYNDDPRDRYNDNDRTNGLKDYDRYNQPYRDDDSNVVVGDSEPQVVVQRGVNKSYLDKMKRKYKQKISANVSGTKFEIVREVLEALGCRIMPDENFDCNIIWDDTRVSIEGVSELKAFQRFNHFPAMSEISRKDALARNILKMSRVMPNEFDFVPRTWIMPTEYSSLQSHAADMRKLKQPRTYIAKPSNGAMGHGIKLYKNPDKIQPVENYIVQEYIANPYLLDGYKFDLRIYALVTSCDPLRAFIYNNGLVRLGTEEYQEPTEQNIDHLYMHLTNYSVNKRSKKYDEGDSSGEKGTKRSLKYLFEHFRRNNVDSSKVWKRIQDIILKTILVAEPYLFHTYKMCRPGQLPGAESVCFEILGFDILIDDNLRPWVLEVNRCPSFGATQQIDHDIKSRLLVESLDLLHLRSSDRQRVQMLEKVHAKRRLYNGSTFDQKQSLANGSSVSIVGGGSTTNGAGPQPTQSTSSLNSTNALSIKKSREKERKKLELIEQIKMFRREQRRHEYENRNMGNYSRLFPIEDKTEMNYYLNILSHAFNLFYPISKQLQWKKTYERIKEDELIGQLVECDEEIAEKSDYEQQKLINQYLKDKMDSDSESPSEDEDSDRENGHRGHHHHHHDRLNLDRKRVEQDKSTTSRSIAMKAIIEQESVKANRVATLLNAVADNKKQTKPPKRSESTNSGRITSASQNLSPHDHTMTDDTMQLMKQIKQHQTNLLNTVSTKPNSVKIPQSETVGTEDEIISSNHQDKLTLAALKLLNELEIKFPGKTDQQTRALMQKFYSNFEIYKPKLGNYWMAKLDDAKRTKILNIVKTNVTVILQKVFNQQSVENLRLYKIICRLLNRLLWSHGQGLWNCFVNSSVATSTKSMSTGSLNGPSGAVAAISSPWESIFSKSTFQVSEVELKCCHRVEELCKDCVVVVFQYAFEQIPANSPATNKSGSSNDLSTTNMIGRSSALARNKSLITAATAASPTFSTPIKSRLK